jgi:hypothetical protein
MRVTLLPDREAEARMCRRDGFFVLLGCGANERFPSLAKTSPINDADREDAVVAMLYYFLQIECSS